MSLVLSLVLSLLVSLLVSFVVSLLALLSVFFLLLVLLSSFIAIIQLTGRVGIHFIAQLEAPINKLLEENGIEIRKLSGYWQRANPVVNIGQVVTSSGHLSDVILEIDLLESLARNRFVARNFSIDSGYLEFDSGIEELFNFSKNRPPNPFLDFFYLFSLTT